jgi:hypothetical protein
MCWAGLGGDGSEMTIDVLDWFENVGAMPRNASCEWSMKGRFITC